MVTVQEALAQTKKAEASAQQRQRDIAQAEARARKIRVGGTVAEQFRFGSSLPEARRLGRQQRERALQQIGFEKEQLGSFRSAITERQQEIASVQASQQAAAQFNRDLSLAQKIVEGGRSAIGQPKSVKSLVQRIRGRGGVRAETQLLDIPAQTLPASQALSTQPITIFDILPKGVAQKPSDLASELVSGGRPQPRERVTQIDSGGFDFRSLISLPPPLKKSAALQRDVLGSLVSSQDTVGDIQQRLRQERAQELISGFESLTPSQAAARATAGERGFTSEVTPEGTLVTFDTTAFAGDIRSAGDIGPVREEVGTGGLISAGVRSVFVGAGKFGLSVPEFVTEDILLGGTTRAGTPQQLRESPQVSLFDTGIFKKAKEIPSDPVQVATGLGLTIAAVGPSILRAGKLLKAEGISTAAGELATEFAPIKLKPGVFTPDIKAEQIRGTVRDIGIEDKAFVQVFSGKGVQAKDLDVLSVGAGIGTPSGPVSTTVTAVRTPFIEITKGGKVTKGTLDFVIPSVSQPTKGDPFAIDTRLGTDVIAQLEARPTKVTQRSSIENILGGEKTLRTIDTGISRQEQFVFGSDIIPEVTRTRQPLIQDVLGRLPKPSTTVDPFTGRTIKTGREGLLDIPTSAIESFLPSTPTAPQFSTAQIFGKGQRVRFKIPEISEEVGTTILGRGKGRRTPFQEQITPQTTSDFTSNVAASLRSVAKDIQTPSISVQDPQFGLPTIVGGAGARGQFTGTGQFERTGQIFVGRGITRPSTDLGLTTDVGGLTGRGFGGRTVFDTPLAFRGQSVGLGLVSQFQGAPPLTVQRRGLVSSQLPASLVIPALGSGTLLGTPQRQREELALVTEQAALLGFDVPSQPVSRAPTLRGFGFGFDVGRGFLFAPTPLLSGAGRRPRRVRGRRKRKVRIRPSFTASALDITGPLPTPTVIGGVDIGILPGQIRRIPRRRRKTKGTRKVSVRKKTKAKRTTTKKARKRKKR